MQAQVIQWAKQFGTTGNEYPTSVAVTQGAIYAAGQISQGTFPGQTLAGSVDGFVTKFALDGTAVWSRQFGSEAADYTLGVTADATGVYVVGYTLGSLQGTSVGREDAFVRKYNPNGDLLWSRQFGTAGNDQLTSAAVDSSGLYVGGVTGDVLPGQTSAGGTDCFLRKYDLNGNEVWTRQFGTANAEKIYGVAVDNGSIYVGGDTNGALGTALGSTDNFVRKYDANGNAQWTVQFGTSGDDGGFYGDAIAANSTGVYVASHTTGTLPGQTNIGGWDAYVQKISLNGVPQWARQVGSTSGDSGYGIAVGPSWVYAVGETNGTALWRFDVNGNEMGRTQGGLGADTALGAASDGSGVYVVGSTSGTNFGLTGLGGTDGFIYKVPHPPVITGVGEAFTGLAGVAPTTWISLYGTNLAPEVKTWDSFIVGSQLPLSLEGLSARINNKPATLHFVSPSQVNVLAPLDDFIGNVEVTLSNPYGASPPIQVRKSDYMPGFYAPFGETGKGLFVTAVALDGSLLGKPGVDPRVSRAPRPNEIIQFFATGFGKTTPLIQSDQLFSLPPEVQVSPRVTIGGRTGRLFSKGNLIAPGLYQFNIKIPDLADGGYGIQAEIRSERSSGKGFLSIKR